MSFGKGSKIKSNLISVFITSLLIIALSTQTLVGNVYAQTSGGAYFTRAIVNNGLDSIDLVNGGQAKVMQGQTVWCNLTFYNDNLGTTGARLFTKLFVDGSLVGISSSQYIFRYLTGSQYWRLPDLGAGPHNVRVELWWDDSGTHHLQDTRTFQVYVVQLLPKLSAQEVSVPRGSAKGTGWVVSVSNEGNDIMYRTILSVVDSAGLKIYPQTVSLDDLMAGAIKSALFTLVAPSTFRTGQYSIKFSVDYSDFVGNTCRDYFYGTVTVTKPLSSVSVTLDKSTAMIGDTVTVQATLTSGDSGLANQKIEFLVDESTIGYGTTDSSGHTAITYVVNLPPGAHTIRAHFAETSDFLASDGTANLLVLAIPTNISLAIPQSLTEGTSATLSAVLTDSKGNPLQGQTVKFLANGTVVGSTKTDSSGRASLEFIPKSQGYLQFQAVYDGAGNYAPSSSQISTAQVAPNLFGSTSMIVAAGVAVLVIVIVIAAYLALQKAKKK